MDDISTSELRQYFDGSSDLYCELDTAGFFLYVSAAWTKSLGYEPTEIVGKNFTVFLHPQDAARSTEAYNDEDDNRPDKGAFRNRYRHKNGKYRTFLWTGRFDPKRNIMCTHARDVTAETYRASLLTRVAAIQDSYMKQEPNKSGLFEKLLGEICKATESEIGFIGEIGEHLLTREKFALYATNPKFSADNLAKLTAEVIETKRGRADDTFLTVPLFYLGDLIGMFAVSGRHGGYDQELSANLKTLIEATASVVGLHQTSIREKALRERFMVVVENLPIMLTEYDTNGRLTWANRFFHEKTGIPDSAMSSSDVLDLIVMDEAEGRRAKEFMLSGRTDWEDFSLLHTNGTTFPTTWTNIRLKDGRAIGIGQDLTDRRLAESKMIQSSKMASLGEMSAGVSHEINNPLAIIQGSAFRAIQNLTAPNGKSAEVEGDLNRIIQNCHRIASIVRGLRAFSRSVDHEPFIPTPLNNVIEDVMNLAQERFKSHDIKIHIDGDCETIIDCRPVQLVQVLMNLLNNAFDAVSDQSGAKSVWINAKLVGSDRLHLSVEDSGPGIPAALQDRILEPFFTTKEIGKGTGLGLSISKGLIESHNGRMWLDSKSKRTRFVIDLPIRHDLDI